MTNINNEVSLDKAREIVEEFRGKKGILIQALQKIQASYGYIPRNVMEYISRELNIPESTIYGVVTFYAQFRLKPAGKNVIRVCHGTACHVGNAPEITAALESELGIKDGDTTDDGMFSLESVACLGCCSLAPVMTVNGIAYGKLTPDKARKIIRNMKEA
jgi:NADH-quinone oxidoreductase subunit E